MLDGPTDRGDVLDQGRNHHLRIGARQVGEQDDPDAGIG
jgi:hypothetical protein